MDNVGTGVADLVRASAVLASLRPTEPDGHAMCWIQGLGPKASDRGVGTAAAAAAADAAAGVAVKAAAGIDTRP